MIGLTARRSGNVIVVRWRMNRPASGIDLTVIGLATRDGRATPLAVDAPGSIGGNQRRFAVRLRNTAALRWVVVLGDENGLASHMRRTWVRVRG